MALLNKKHLIIVAVLGVAFGTAITAFIVIGLPTSSPCVNASGNVHGFTIVAGQNGYNNSKTTAAPWPVMSVEKCDHVTISFSNEDIQAHGLAVDFYSVRGLSLAGGDTTSISFVATKTGQFRVYCNIFCTVHLFMQDGLLDVE